FNCLKGKTFLTSLVLENFEMNSKPRDDSSIPPATFTSPTNIASSYHQPSLTNIDSSHQQPSSTYNASSYQQPSPTYNASSHQQL
ncbi:8802_t:CDS:1, partial [Racocetra fulgida]